MADETLTHDELLRQGSALIQPFDFGCPVHDKNNTRAQQDNKCRVASASYDLAVGGLYYRFQRESSRKRAVEPTKKPRRDSLEPGEDLHIDPLEMVIVRTLEKLSIPDNVKGRLSLRTKYAQKLLISNAGLIDPGYGKGHPNYLFVPVVNVGPSAVSLSHGERVWQLELVRIGEGVRGSRVEVSEILPPERLPDAPAERTFDYLEIQEGLRDVQTDVVALRQELREKAGTMQTTGEVIKGLLGAGLAGLIAGLLVPLGLARAIGPSSGDDPILSVATFAVAFLLIYGVVRLTSRDPRSR